MGRDAGKTRQQARADKAEGRTSAAVCACHALAERTATRTGRISRSRRRIKGGGSMTVAELQTPSAGPKSDVMFRHILVATDFSEASGRALENALGLAAEYGSRVTLVHVLQPDRQYATLECPPKLDLQIGRAHV